MFRETILDIFANNWPMILIFTTIIVSIRVTQLLYHKESFHFYKEILSLGFVIYILCLFYVVTFQDVSWSSSNFVPFTEMFRYRLGTNMFYRNVIGNMIMFVPYGFFVSYYLKPKKGYIIFLLSFIASATIETTQMQIGRVFDIDDILLNLCGGMLGYLLYEFIICIKAHLPQMLKKEVFYNIIMVIAICVIIAYLCYSPIGG